VPALDAGTFLRRVLLIRSHPALDTTLYHKALAGPSAPGALVVELYACATAAQPVVELAADCSRRGIPVLACPVAPIDADDAAYPSTAELTAAGASLHLGATVELLVPVAASLR
jgi:hypothetical protein